MMRHCDVLDPDDVARQPRGNPAARLGPEPAPARRAEPPSAVRPGASDYPVLLLGGPAAPADYTQNVYTQMPFPCWVYDIESRAFLDANPAAERTYGYTLAEFRGMTLGDIREPGEQTRLQATLAVQTPGVHRYFWNHRTKSGQILAVKVVSNDIVWFGRAARLVFVTDISPQRAADLEIKMLYECLETATDMVVITAAEADHHGNRPILYVNRAFERHTGYARNAVVGRDPRFLQGPGTDPSQLAQVRGALANWQPVTIELLNYRPDGTSYWVEMTITPVADDCGWYHYCFAVERDVSERKRAQQQLTDQNDALEARVAQRTHELQQTVRDLESFSQTIAHDLQNPLTSVRSFADLLLQDHAAVLPADATHMLRLMQRSTVHMQQIIRDLQALANINRMAARPVPTDLVALCRPLFTELQATDARRSVQVVMPARIDVHADLQLLRVVFDSLLDNAWKYTSKTASACITLSAVSGPGGVVVTVADNGAGFDAAAAHRLFTPFHRLHRASQFNGTGIGLAAAARAVERMAGWVWADGRPDGGARIHVFLPAFLPSASQSGVDQLHAKRDCSDASASA